MSQREYISSKLSVNYEAFASEFLWNMEKNVFPGTIFYNGRIINHLIVCYPSWKVIKRHITRNRYVNT